jgi:hypothetical protein
MKVSHALPSVLRTTGQTRDVHIYRLITEHTVEENILSKAKQKKSLDVMVMDQGNFDPSSSLPTNEPNLVTDNVTKEVYTKKGLQAILGVTDDETSKDIPSEGDARDLSNEQMEMVMTAFEDEDDVNALRGAQKEAADELKEFDESAEIQTSSDDEGDDTEKRHESFGKGLNAQKLKETKQSEDVVKRTIGDNVDENDLESEFAAWQSSEGFDGTAIEKSLTPTERYGIRFHESIDPYFSIFSINQGRRRVEATEEGGAIDIVEMERGKAKEERRAMEDGDLLSTGAQPGDLVRQRNLYRREKARLRSDKKRRKLKGENWSQRIDGLSQKSFWYNEDTGEAIWDIPRQVAELRADDMANKEGWSKLPIQPLVHIMEYLIPFPDRQRCSEVCRQWKLGANDIQFVRHVYPLEMGALLRESSRREYNHFFSISDAIEFALPGDTIGRFKCQTLRFRTNRTYKRIRIRIPVIFRTF